MRANTSVTLGVFAAAALSGCAVDSLEIGTESQAFCSMVYGCGDNSAVINGYPVHELELGGQVTPDNFRLIDVVTPQGFVGQLDVRNGHPYIYSSTGIYMGGPEMIGSDIRVEHTSEKGTTTLYNIRIEAYAPEPAWVEPRSVPSYYLSYWGAGGDRVPLCRTVDPKDPTSYLVTPAIFIRGERYDRKAMRVTDSGAAAATWFNIACAGSALGKMRLMAYDPEKPKADPFYTEPGQRQSAVKMITADYCGIGESFTETGTPLRWQNKALWCQPGKCSFYPDPALNLEVEAIWNDEGVVCLNTPRLADRAEVEAKCGYAIPDCSGFTPGDGEWQTFLP